MQVKCIQDGDNVSIRVAECVYKGQTVTHSASFPHTLGALESLESYQPRADDIWLISYPKSGTHWLFEILGILLSGTLEPLDHYKQVAFVEAKTHISEIPTLYGRRIYNTHLKPEYLPAGVLEKCTVIYVARNPKSVAVSFYKQAVTMKAYEYTGTFQGYLPVYLQGVYSIWGTWFDHVPVYWDRAKHRSNVSFMFYEDLVKNPADHIHDLSVFLGLHHTKQFCCDVAKLASLQNMKSARGKCEQDKDMYSSMWKEGGGFFRKGDISDWKSEFTVAQNQMFDQIYQQKMSGYPKLKEKIKFS